MGNFHVAIGGKTDNSFIHMGFIGKGCAPETFVSHLPCPAIFVLRDFWGLNLIHVLFCQNRSFDLLEVKNGSFFQFRFLPT